MEIRPCQPDDVESMSALLNALDFPVDSTLTGGVFWVVVLQQDVIGVCFVEHADPAVFISYVGVDPNFRKQGVSKQLINTISSHYQRDIYLDTVLPQIYLSMGFYITDRPDFLPDKVASECEHCQPQRCVCMVKYYGPS